METKKIRNTVFLLITALIWGTAFVAQSEGGKEIGPCSSLDFIWELQQKKPDF